MRVQVQGLKKLTSRLDALGLRAKFMAAKALNETSEMVVQSERQEVQELFDRPTPYVVRGIRMRNASVADLTAKVYYPGTAEGRIQVGDILRPQIEGGERRPSGTEYHLWKAGILPPDKYLAPARAPELDWYGNVPAYVYVKMLSDLQAFDVSSFKRPARMNRSIASALRKPQQFYVRVIDGVPIGIYRRTGSLGGSRKWSTIKDTPYFNFISKPYYKQRFEFYRIGDVIVRREMVRKMRAAIREIKGTDNGGK